jgi:putative membrane protein
MLMILWFLLGNAIGVFITAHILPGVTVKNFGHALLVAIVLAIINSIVRPILLYFAIPLTLITFGLFVLVVNALIIMFVDVILPGFKVKHFGWAVLFSIVLSLINGLLAWVFF